MINRHRIRLTSIILLSGLFIFLGCAKNTDPVDNPSGHVHGIIPLPLNVDLATGQLKIDGTATLVNNPEFHQAVSSLGGSLDQVLKSPPKRSDIPSSGVNIRFDPDSSLAGEAYRIDISSTGIAVKAGSAAGAFYGAQSLRQMIWNATSGSVGDSFSLRCMTIKDKPEYAWRGFHLDVSRHFFASSYVLSLIDWLAYYKINRLHLHLTDDQGWRIETTRFPLLTEVGGWRNFIGLDSTCMELAKKDINYNLDPRFIREVNGKPVYGGYYTRSEISEIVAHAAENFIEVIPEIDMPGHMSAAIRAYPWLSCADSAGWGKEFSFPVCPCKEEVMNFCYQVWDDLADLFPSKYFHIGSDEVEKDTWAASPACQEFMKANNIRDLNGIQNYFVRKMQEHLEAKGKKVIAWDDVIEGQIDNKITVMYWREWVKDSPARSAANGNDIILTPWDLFYLAGVNTDDALEKLYNYKPSDIYPREVLNRIIGLQTCVWTEEVPSEVIFEKIVYPRMQALSEISWSPGRSWYSFQVRMQSHFDHMNVAGIHYRHPGWMK